MQWCFAIFCSDLLPNSFCYKIIKWKYYIWPCLAGQTKLCPMDNYSKLTRVFDWTHLRNLEKYHRPPEPNNTSRPVYNLKIINNNRKIKIPPSIRITWLFVLTKLGLQFPPFNSCTEILDWLNYCLQWECEDAGDLKWKLHVFSSLRI